MRQFVLAAAAIAAVAGTANADRIGGSVTGLGHYIGSESSGTRAGPFITGYEAAEGYALGNINGQNGWQGLGAAFQGTGSGSEVQNVNPFAGTQDQNSVKDPAVSAGIFNGAWHNSAAGGGSQTTNVKVRISGAETTPPNSAYADYFLQGVALAGNFAWGVHFSFTGQIYANNNTTTALAPIIYGQYVDLTTTYNQLTNAFTITYNGNLIYNALGYTGTGSPFAYDKVAWLSDNFNLPTDEGRLDNLVVTPAPGSATLLGMGLIAAARRRRR